MCRERRAEANQMNIRCIALDLDRTTLNKNGKLSEGNRAALRQAIEKGIHVIVASGRCFYSLPEEIRSFPGISYAVTGNGAAMYHVPDCLCLQRYGLSEEAVNIIMEETKDEPVTYEAVVDGTAYAGKEYMENPALFGATPQALEYVRATRRQKENISSFIMENRQKLDCMDIIVNDADRKKEIWRRIKERTKEVYITSSAEQLIELSGKEAGKHSGVAYFAERLGLEPEEIAAFGDSDNDVDMLLYAGTGIAMENATDSCKTAADYITKNHDEDGVAWGMREILGIGQR